MKFIFYSSGSDIIWQNAASRWHKQGIVCCISMCSKCQWQTLGAKTGELRFIVTDNEQQIKILRLVCATVLLKAASIAR